MLFKRLLDIFRTKPNSQTKKGEITCTECGLVYDNTLGFFKREANECPDCQYIKILTDKSFDEISDGLRMIRTIRGETAIKAAKDMGLKLLELKAEVSDEFKVKYKKLQHRKTGEIITIGDFREDNFYSSLGYKTLVDWTSKNPSKFFSPYAAYIVPKDLKSGERVLINDVITNHVSGRWNQGDVYRLSKSEAIWTGRYFDIDVSSYAIGEFIG
jgi:rubredoxin